jgi:hypothetical protein
MRSGAIGAIGGSKLMDGGLAWRYFAYSFWESFAATLAL